MIAITGATIFSYCERGRDPSFWAEPLNAVSNGAFVIAGFAALVLLARQPKDQRGWPEAFFALQMIVIGIGSFLFHTYATAWAAAADVVPIGIFMLTFFAYALRQFPKMNWIAVAIALGVFALSLKLASELSCSAELLPVTAAAGRPCLNGSLAYVPAFAAMLLIGVALKTLGHPAANRVLTAGVVFAVSLTARTLDFEVCAATAMLGAVRGTHMLWHILNAVTLYLLTTAAILHGQAVPQGGLGKAGG
jgi:Ceramidase